MKKGFTLVELLAVIAIIVSLVLIISFSVAKGIKSSKEKLYESQINTIKSAANVWVVDNLDDVKIEGCYYITLEKLQDGYIDPDLKDPRTNKAFNSQTTYIKIITTNISSNISFEYDVLTTIPNSCTQIN